MAVFSPSRRQMANDYLWPFLQSSDLTAKAYVISGMKDVWA
ncbi:MAG: hypothetical protein PHE38_03365 [Alishewanella agri]|nr:hypothetical protein [Alishewanella agri]